MIVTLFLPFNNSSTYIKPRFILELNKFSRKRNRRKSKREEDLSGLNTIRRLIDNWSNLNGHAWNINTISTQSN